MLVEAWNTLLPGYVDLPYGTRHPDAGKWPEYRLVKQQPLEGDEKWVMRFWVADEVVPDTYNVEKQTFDADDNNYPEYVRNYWVRRTEYTPATKAQPLTGITGVQITAGGSGYDHTTTVAITGGDGTGATGVPIVFRGAVVGVYMTAEGSGYTNASLPTVTFTGPAGSAGATGVAQRQNKSAVLVKEETDRIEGEPSDGLYIKVTRFYIVLPGATLTTTKVGEQGAIETSTIRKRLAGSSSIAGGYLVLENAARALSTVVESHERTVIDAWPTLTEYDQHPELKSLITTTYEVVDATAVSAPSAVNNIITKYHKIDKFKSLKIVTTYATPATYDQQRFMAYNFATALRAYAWTEGCGTFISAQWGQSVMVQARTEISYTTTKQTISGLFVFTNTFRLGTFSVTDVLNDADTVTFTGSCVGTLAIPASIPSATAYLALFNGTEQLISGESVRSELAGLWRNTKLYITFPDLT